MPIATSSDKIILSSEKKTEELANKLLKKFKLGDIVFLYGEIGVGKTTFVRYLINGFQKENNIKLTEVTSPTFNIINEYEINQTKINHYDLFRIKSVEETKNLGLFDNLSNSITLVEWPQIIKEKPKNLIEFDFKYENDHQQRYVEIKGLNFNFK
jgi:tRNA threonylcarbamoyl adenosine modification protein YjeE